MSLETLSEKSYKYLAKIKIATIVRVLIVERNCDRGASYLIQKTEFLIVYHGFLVSFAGACCYLCPSPTVFSLNKDHRFPEESDSFVRCCDIKMKSAENPYN